MVIEFLKSLVIPAKMKKYRYMSILIAIAIFVLTVYLLIIPYRITMNNSKDDMIDENVLGVLGFYNVETDDQESFNEIKSGGYKIEEIETDGGRGEYALTTSLKDNGEYQHFTFNYENEDGEDVVVHFIFDPFGVRDKKLLSLLDDYNETYNLEDNASSSDREKASEIAMITYVELVKNPELDVEAEFEKLRGLSENKLSEKATELSFFDYYDIDYTENKNSYLVIFNPNNLDYQIPLYYEEERLPAQQTRANLIYSAEIDFDVANFSTVNDLGRNVVDNIMDVYIVSTTSQQTIQVIIFVLVYPAIIILIIWLFFRKNGTMKTYKEYYNIAAICSIVPSVITFMISWFWVDVISTYGMILAVYYIFIIYRVNAIPDQV